MTPALTAELRHAARVIRDAFTGPATIDPVALHSAHRTLTQRRPDADHATREAIDYYLDDDTWHHGPHVLRHAALNLARQLAVPTPEPTDHIWEQPQLFNPDT
jgi:hypothetical protein